MRPKEAVATSRLLSVVAIFVTQDQAQRRRAEDEMVRSLENIRAVPGYLVLTADDLRDSARARDKLVAGRFDGTIEMRILGQENLYSYQSSSPSSYLGMNAAMDPNFTPGYERRDVAVKTRTLVYSVPQETVLWSATTRTINPRSTTTLVHDVTRTAAKDLEKKGVFPGR